MLCVEAGVELLDALGDALALELPLELPHAVSGKATSSRISVQTRRGPISADNGTGAWRW
ncbi:MAG TPA: hypothetical protein VEF89_02930 [Solirubrobacteraceae bacterium]|nr:hypothetical protein [Solirubrobacteraceae bacterium]